jgi:hypothetical protein
VPCGKAGIARTYSLRILFWKRFQTAFYAADVEFGNRSHPWFPGFRAGCAECWMHGPPAVPHRPGPSRSGDKFPK